MALLYFLVIPFVAVTEPVARQLFLYALVLVGYLAAVLAVPRDPLAGMIGARLGVLGAACAVGTFLARALHRNTVGRVRAEEAVRMERLLTTEAHHRIKNNLQLVADLLILEADRGRDNPAVVVEETLSPIQSVAAVHQSLAQRLAVSRHAEFETMRTEVGRLQEALETRRLVERAKGILMDRVGLSEEEEAFLKIQRRARDANHTMADVARQVIDAADILQ